MPDACPFCARIVDGVVTAADGPVVAFPDGFPVTDGHTLVVPRRHVSRIAGLTDEEWAALHRLGRSISASMAEGVTYGINDGQAAGQTVHHVHLHVIPRRHGDVDDPRGGLRWVVPGRARYWEPG